MNKVLGYRKMLAKRKNRWLKNLTFQNSLIEIEKREKLILKNEMIKFKTLLIEKGLKDITLDDIF